MTRVRHERPPRLIARCQVDFEGPGGWVYAESEDLSATGIFVRTEALLPVGSAVWLTITLPTGEAFSVWAEVAHLLTLSAATALGRHPGMGLQFADLPPEGAVALGAYLASVGTQAPSTPSVDTTCHVLVVEGSPPLRERLSRALEQVGFDVDAQPDGRAALLACEMVRPDVIITGAQLPQLSGAALIRRLALHPGLVDIPVVMIGDDGSDHARLEAYRLGVREYIAKPFLDEELLIRVHRLVAEQQRSAATVSLRGSLGDVSLMTLLSLFEFERKSGLLLLVREGALARLFVSEGRVLKVESADLHLAPRDRLRAVLAWTEGQFEFTACTVAGVDEVGVPTTQLLLEHAQRTDEEAR
ncbi:MAG: response regulator [Kofleriaceae bacterium]